MIEIHFLNVGYGDCIIIENFNTGSTMYNVPKDLARNMIE